MISVLNIIAYVVFSTSLFTRSFDPVIPLVAADFNIDPATAALLATAYTLPYALVQPIHGALADMIGKTRLMTASLIVLAAASFAAAFAPSFSTLFASRVVAGIAAGGVFPVALAFTGDLVPVSSRQIAIGRLLAAGMTSNLLGASGAGVIGDFIGWRGVPVATGIFALVAIVVAVIGFRGVAKDVPARFDLTAAIPNFRSVFANPLAKVCFGAVFLEGVFLFGLFPYMASLLQAQGETRASVAGIVIAGFAVGGLVYSFSVSRLLSLFGERGLMLVGGTLMGVGLLVVALRLPWQFQVADFVLIGFAFYMLHGCIHVHVTELAPAARGSATASHSASFHLGNAVGPIYYGFAFSYAGVTATLALSAIVVAIAGIWCAAMLRHRSAAS